MPFKATQSDAEAAQQVEEAVRKCSGEIAIRFVIRPKLSKWEKKVAEANTILEQDALKIARKGGLNGRAAPKMFNYRTLIKTNPEGFTGYSNMLPTTVLLSMQKMRNDRLANAGLGSILQSAGVQQTSEQQAPQSMDTAA